MISIKALAIRDRLVESHNESPFLSEHALQHMVDFTGSLSWASKVAKASGWKSRALHGEAGSVDVEAVEPEIEKVRKKIREYDLDNVYNMDETGLWFKLLPNRSYIKADEAKTARGTKNMKVKDRVTIFVTTNATGTDLVPLSLIGKSKNPRCFKNARLRLKYFDQKKAWSDSKVFAKWWQHFLYYIRNRTTKKVLLILDNCGPHGSELIDPLRQVTVIFLPPNVTSVFQPMDCGVIALIKKNYRYRLLRKMLEIFEERQSRREAAKRAKMQAGTKGLKEGHAPHLKDAMDILYEVWSDTSALKVKNCWIKSTLVSFDPPTPVTETTEEANTEVPAPEANVDEPSAEEEQYSSDDGAVFNLLAEFVEKNDCKPTGTKVNDFDAVLEEMVLTVKQCDGDDLEDMKRMVDGWISMEDTEFCKDLLANEVEELMDIDTLCQLKPDANEAEEEDADDEIEDAGPKEPISYDAMNEWAAQLKAISVKIAASGEDYAAAAMSVSDASENVRSAFRKANNKKKASKRDVARQHKIGAFFKK